MIFYISFVFFVIISACFRDAMDGSYMDGFDFKTIPRGSIYSCAVECMSYSSWCKSFNFVKNERQCLLNFENQSTIPDSLQPSANMIYSDITVWSKAILGACQTIQCADLEKCAVTRTGTICQSIVSNVAQDKTATSSSRYASSILPTLATDGSPLSVWEEGSCWGSADSDSRPWWTVDLADTYLIFEVHILNRLDCCADRLREFVIEVSRDAQPSVTELCHNYTDTHTVPGGALVLPCDRPVLARQVTLRVETERSHGDLFQFCEVMVMTLV